MAKSKPRVKVPKKVSAGDIITIKTLISHKMESGRRKDKKTGELIPRHIIDKFTAKLDGVTFFEADWHGAVSANPYTSFTLKAEKSGELEFIWHDEQGEVFSKKAQLNVS